MKINNIINRSLAAAMVALAAVACSEEVNYGGIDVPGAGASDGDEVVYVTDNHGNAGTPSVEYRGTSAVELHATSTHPVAVDKTVQFTYDAAALDTYNARNGSKFEAVPESMVSLSNGGVVTIAAGEKQSEALSVTLTSDGSLDHEKTYAIPLTVTSGDSRANVGEASRTQIIFVRDLTGLADCAKTWFDEDSVEHEGIKIFSVMEVNDTNPLNNLRFTLKNSGKYMVDALVIFSGNINYNAETGRVYFFPNPNVKHLLSNKDKYLKPLKDRGMRVIMGVMCNHDRACISNLADATAREFAKELNGLCDAYDLDGIFWDDEYCSPIYPAPPGFTNRSNLQWSRLAYEFWKLNPTHLNVAYGYSMTGYGATIDGVQAGTFISYVLPDYGYGIRDWSSSYAGMKKSQMGAYSFECAKGNFGGSESNMRAMRDQGYGAHMVFAMDPFRSTAWSQEQAMDKLARAFYDDEVVVDPVKYEKDW